MKHLKQLAPPKEGESNQELLLRHFSEQHIKIEKRAAVFLDEKKGRLFVRTTLADQDKIEGIVQRITEND